MQASSLSLRRGPVCALAVLGLVVSLLAIPAGAETTFDRAAAAAAARQVVQGRAEETSTLARAVLAVRGESGLLGGLAREARTDLREGSSPQESRSLSQLLLERENLRLAYGVLRDAAGDRPATARPATSARHARATPRGPGGQRHGQTALKGPLLQAQRLLTSIDRLEAAVRAGDRREVGRRLAQVEHAAERVHSLIERDAARTSRIVRAAPRPVTRAASAASRSALAPVVPPRTTEVSESQRAGTQLTPEISALAAELNFDPLAIYLHVRNNFRFETYFGCLKGAQATLETGAGNDYDLAALTGSLLSASGFNVRYGRGTAIVPAQAMLEWLGLEDVAAANSILNTAGIAATPVVSGPDIIEYRVDRLWVEVETAPRPGGAPVWLPLDTAFKRHDLTPGVPGLLAAVPFDEATYLSVTRTELTWEFYAQQVQTWLDANMAGSTVADAPLVKTPVPEALGNLPRSLPYRLFSFDTIYSSIPATLSHKATIRVASSGGTEFSHQIVLPDTALQRITVSYSVDPADQSIVDGFGGLANTPPGAADVIPQLKLDGALVAAGGSIPYLDGVTLEVDFFRPEGDLFDGTVVHTVRAGEWAAVGIDAYQISETHLQRQVDSVVAAITLENGGGTADPDDLIGAFLYLAIMQYLDEVRTGEDALDDIAHFTTVRFVSEGIASANQDVISIGGAPFTTIPGALVVDVPRLNRTGFALDDDDTLQPDLRRISGFNGSAQEHAIWESFLNVDAISTIKSLQVANESGIPVFVIDDNDVDPNNDCSILCPQLTLGAPVETAIQNDVAAGNRVTVPRDPTTLLDWTGVGYITEDPIGGSVGYIISGGLSSSSGLPPRFGGAPLSGGATAVILEDGSVVLVPVGDIGDAPGTANTGDPVNIANGNFFRDEMDFIIPALAEPLAVARTYNSQSTFDGPLGLGWQHGFADQLFVQPDTSVIWIDGRGTAFTFQPDSMNPGEFFPPAGLRETLIDTGSTFTMTRYDGRIVTFDANGLMQSRADRAGNTYTFGYDVSDRLETITDPASRSLTLTYNAADKIDTVSDFTGRTWSYAYDTGDRLMQVSSPSDALTPARITQYAYTVDGLLSTITEPNGGVRRVSYYANGRVAQVIDPHGYPMTLVYNGFKAETFVTNERGLTEVHGYNGAGNRVSLAYPDRSVDRWAWVDNRITQHVDPLGNIETFEYDPEGNLERTVDPSNIETLYAYEPPYSNLTTVTRPGGRTTVRQYDPSGNLTQETDGAGNIRTVTPNAQGLVASATDGRSNPIAFGYGVDGQMTTRTTTLPSVETVVYDPRGTVQQKIDANTDPLTFTYDLLDRPLTETDAEGNLTSFDYDQGGRLISKTDPRGKLTLFDYDLKDRLIKITHPDGGEVTFEYDQVGNLLRRTDELGRVTRAVFDARNRQVELHDPDGGVTRTEYDAAGRITAVTDARGNSTQYEYDDAGRKSAEIDARGERTQWTFDANGNRATQLDRNGGLTTFEYDALNRLTEVRGEGGRINTFDYDGNGNITESADYDVLGLGSIPDDPRTLPDARKRVRSRTYDVLNRLETETDPEGETVTYGYDPAGNLVSVLDPRMRTIIADYDDVNRLTRLVRPDLGEVLLTYDAAGNRVSLETPRGGVYRWTYDDRNRVSGRTDPGGASTTFEYDLVGNRVRQLHSDGSSTSQKYDSSNRRVLTARSDGTYTSHTHDLAGNLLTAVTERTTLAFTYDELNRRTGETLSIPSAGFDKTVAYGYDDEGNVTLVTDPESRTLTYGRDLAGRLGTLTDSSGPTVTVAYNGWSERELVSYGNGTSGQHQYDGNGRPTLIDWTAAIARFDYVRDAIGSPTTIVESVAGQAETLTLVYDDLGRPISSTATVAPGTRSETFDFDLNDNPTLPGNGTVSSFDLSDQIVTGAGGTFGHDERGNRSFFDDGSIRVETGHDPGNRLTRIQRFVGGMPDSDARLTYDGLGRLVEIVNGAGATRIAYAFDNRLVEYDGASAVDVLYTVGTGLDDVFATTVGGTLQYLHRDTSHSVRAVTNAAGAVAGWRQYGLFGRLQASGGAAGLPLGFTGRPFDASTGLIDLRARHYDPQTGTFVSRDPISFPALVPNPYSYSANRPLILFDPWGLSPQPERGFWSTLWDDGFLLVDVGFLAFDILTFPSGEAAVGIAARRAGREVIEEVAEQGVRRQVRNEVVEETTQRGGRAIVELGKAGERAVGDIGPKIKVAINGRNRIPDGMTNTVLSEVKNVKNLSFTRQLRDFADYAQQTGRRFDLYVRSNTNLSGPLVDAVRNGVINLKVIP